MVQDTLLTGALYVLLVGATLGLQCISELLKKSKLHYKTVVFLEHAIFFGGSLVVLLVLIYLTALTTIDLARSFRTAVAAPIAVQAGAPESDKDAGGGGAA